MQQHRLENWVCDPLVTLRDHVFSVFILDSSRGVWEEVGKCGNQWERMGCFEVTPTGRKTGKVV